MKRMLWVLTLMLAVVLTGVCVWGSGISVMLDGTVIPMDGDTGMPYMDPAGRVMVPLRVVAEKAGASVAYDTTNRLAIVKTMETEIIVPVDKGLVVVNGVNKPNDAPARITNGRTYLPIRIVMESLGYSVNWDGLNSRVLISSASEQPVPGVSEPETPVQEVSAPNTVGNSSINLYNGGLIARENQWLYYVNFADGERLWRVDVKTGRSNVISKGKAASVNVVDGVATYRQQLGSGTWELHRTRGDGTGDEVISQYNTEWLMVDNGNLYFYQSPPLNFYARTEEDPRNLQKITDEMAGISMSKGKLTYTEMEDNGDGTEYPGKIVQRNWDGSGYRVLTDERTGQETGFAAIIGVDLLYTRYSDGMALYRLPEGKSTSVKLTDRQPVSVTGDGSTYYAIFRGAENGLYRVAGDGSGITKIGPDWKPRYDFDPQLQISGDYLYYLEESGRTKSWVRVNRDTGAVKQISSPVDLMEF